MQSSMRTVANGHVAVIITGLITGCGSAPNPELRSTRYEIANYHVSPDRTAVTDGTVRAIAHSGNRLFFGGNLSVIAQRSGSAALVSAADASRVAGYPELQSGVTSAITDDGRGGWFLGGTFRRAGTTAVRGLVHVLATGELDTSFKFSVSGAVLDLARVGDRLYIAGRFSAVQGKPRQNLAAIELKSSGVGGTLATWAPQASSGVDQIEASASTVLVAGTFFSIDGVVRNGLASLDPQTGAVTSVAPSVDQSLAGLSLSGTTAYITGVFTSVGGQPRRGVAAFDTTTGAVLPFRPSDLPNSGMPMVFATPDAVYVTIAPTTELRAYNPSSGARLWSVPFDWGWPMRVARNAGTLYLVGGFRAVAGQTRHFAAALDATTGALLDWSPDPNTFADAVAANGDRVYLGGQFITLRGNDRSMLAAIDMTTRRAVDWKPRIKASDSFSYRVSSLAATDDAVYLGGQFAALKAPGAGEVARQNVAAVDTVSGALLPWNPPDPVTGEVRALATGDRLVFVGGFGVASSGEALRALDRTSAATDPRFSYQAAATQSGAYVNALSSSPDTLYVGGRFESFGGAARAGLAAIDIATGALRDFAPLTAPPSAVREVLALAQNSSTLFVASRGSGQGEGGNVYTDLAVDAFDKASGAPVPGFQAQIDALSLSRAAGAPTVLAADEEALYLGYEYKDGSHTVNVLSSTTGRKLNGFAPAFSAGSAVLALHLAGDALYVGGSFRSAQDYDTGPLARFSRVITTP